MSKEFKLTCDGCGRDLTTTGNSIDYRLALYVERIPAIGNVCTTGMKYPPIKGDAHFCDLNCLKEWIIKE